MPLTPGTRLGPYEVTDQIGVGGMGEVYRATDTNLSRQVAIKVLPDAVAQDSERLARFDREARTLAALNHPNIAAIYGLAEGPAEAGHYMRALVMELVEGPTLADRIGQGAIPLDEALPIAKQIAEALEAAHEQGIIHRDLKPANVKVRPDGTVKLLDFGLAKALAADTVSSGVGSHTISPTITSPAMMTGVGTILGTAAYMSPEQARGRDVDRRADIWAFGAVLFEMLAGRRPFDGEDITEVVGAVVRLEPDWARLPATVPSRIRQVIRACLQKNVKQRIAHMQDVRLALDGAFETSVMPSADAPVARAVRQPLWRRAQPLVATAIVAAAVAAAAMWMLRQQEPPRLIVRSAHLLPAGVPFLNPTGTVVAIAADDRQFLYNSRVGVAVRALDSLSDRVIPGTDGSGTMSPFFSPDGQSVGFYDQAARQLRRISAGGGTSTLLTGAGPVYGISWERDGSILYGQVDGIWQASEEGGAARRVIQTESGQQAAGPRRLPGGDWVLFALTRTAGSARWDGADIVAQSLASGERRVLLQGRGNDARYVPTGHLIYAQGADLYAVAFDVNTLTVTGRPVPVVRGVRRAINPIGGAGSAAYDVSTSGTLIYVPGSATGNALSKLVWVDSQGRREAIGLPEGQYAHPRLSPDGKWLAVERPTSASTEIWLYELSGKAAERRLTEGGNNRYPVWSHDGAYVVFQSDREGDRAIFRQRADGTGVAERLTMPAKGTEHIPEDWSPTEDRLVLSAVTGTSVELSMWTPSDRTPKKFGAAQSSNPFDAVFSPDGKWLAYSVRGSDVTTYAQSVNSSSRYQIGRTEDVVHHPLWSPDGKRLIYFAGGNGSAIAVDIRTEPAFAVGRPTPLPGDGLPLNVMPAQLLNHDVGPDGRFVTILDGGEVAGAVTTSNQIVIVQNWFEELKRLVPIK